VQELSGLLSALVLVAFVGGLAALAHWGKKNRGAEISLIVILLFLSFLVVISGVIVGLVGLSGAIPTEQLPPALSYGSAALLTAAGLLGLALCVPPLRRVTSRRRPVAGATPDDATAAEQRAGFWSDPPVFFGLWLFVLVLATNAVQLLTFVLAPEAVNELYASVGRISVVTILSNQVPFFAIAFLGVGFLVRRNLRETLARLGYGGISLRQLGVVVLFVIGALVLSQAGDVLFRTLQPDLYERVGDISSRLVDTEGMGFVPTVLFGLLIGVGAAFGEETLFRGAVQPVFGIPATSVLFASMHVQYGPSVLLVYVFVLSVGLGLLRRYVNTTATFLAHAGYNFSLVILSFLLSGS
jgi:membrane protease YdiL (CAAX protease family)